MQSGIVFLVVVSFLAGLATFILLMVFVPDPPQDQGGTGTTTTTTTSSVVTTTLAPQGDEVPLPEKGKGGTGTTGTAGKGPEGEEETTTSTGTGECAQAPKSYFTRFCCKDCTSVQGGNPENGSYPNCMADGRIAQNGTCCADRELCMTWPNEHKYYHPEWKKCGYATEVNHFTNYKCLRADMT